MRKKITRLSITIVSICLLFFVSKIFANVQVNTTLGIRPPTANIIFTPVYSTGFFTSGNVYAELTGEGIIAPLYMLTGNGAYTFNYRRGTGPYTTGATFSSSNTRTHFALVESVSRIDKVLPTFSGATSGNAYNADIIITFSDNNSGVTATLDGSGLTNGSTISANGTHTFMVTDIAGNTTGATFIIDKIPPTATLTYTPNSGSRTTGNVLASLTFNESGVTVTNFGGLTERTFAVNGDFTFEFTDRAGNTGSAIAIVTWIDKSIPTYSGFTDGNTYTTDITVTFTDNKTGAIATLNGVSFANGTTISTDGTYTLIVTDALGNSVTASFTISKNAPPSGGGGGGGGGNISDPCVTRTCNSSYYDALCGACTTTETGITIPPEIILSDPTITSEDAKLYSQEMLDAYKYAYKLGITTKNAINEADLYGPLIREHLAKMISEYAIKVVGIIPDNSRKCNFSDIAKESEEMKYYMRLSCKLGLMGLEADGITVRSTFMPNEIVNRAQFGTVFSRLIFGLEYNLKENEMTLFDQTMNALQRTTQNIADLFGINYVANIQIDRYTKHLLALKKNEIIKTIDPIMKELRGYVMIMMMRTDKNGVIQAQHQK